MAAVSRLRRDCVEAKEALSWDTDTTIPVALPNQRTEVRLTRREFEDMIRPTLVDIARRACAGRCDSAQVRPDAADRSVLLVGGSSRIPLVGQMLVADLQRPVAIDVHPKHAVALGAAHLAAADVGTIAVPAEAAATTLEPPVVTRTGRTTVTGPAVAGPTAAAAGVAAAGVAGSAAGSRSADPGWQTGAPGPGEPPPFGPDGRLPRAGEAGADRPPAHGPARDGGGRKRNPLVLAGVGVAAVVALAAAAVFALGGGGDDDPDGGGSAGPSTEPGGESDGGESTAVSLPPDIPVGEPLSTQTLAYTQVEGTFWNVWLVEADGSNPRPLTRETEDKARLPVLAPDRTAVAFSVETGAGWELRVTDSAGTQSRTLTDQIVSDARATWSPDGSRLAFVADPDGVKDVYVFDLATGEMTNLTNTPQDDGDPAWSPDGTTIAYWSRGADGDDIWTIPAAGGEPTQVTRQPGADSDPAWSPSGDGIAFASDRTGNWDVFVMGADGRDQQQLTDNAADDQDPTWSPDGAYLAFETKRDSVDRPDNDWAEIYRMLPDGRDQVRITTHDGLDVHPAWGLAPPA